MKTIALRFGEVFAPKCGTIAAHQEIIDKIGFVWYGKMGARVSNSVSQELMQLDQPQILLISSGKAERYWAFITEISNERPDSNEFPSYYGDKAEQMKTWFKVVAFKKAPGDVLKKCIVTSSGSDLSSTSKHSMSPYFKIEYDTQ